MKRNLFFAAFSAFALAAVAATPKGGISTDDLAKMRSEYPTTPAYRALHNAIGQNDINKLAYNVDNKNKLDMHFSNRVPSKGITDQQSSGRCWLFTGLNVLRAQAMKNHNLPELQLSQVYNWFYDQLEKSNLFLQSIIDTANKPMDDRTVDFLFHNPISDGGQFTGVADIISKYGVVPTEVMPETFTANNTSRMRQLISLKLREDGLELRQLVADGKKKEAETRKQQMIGEIYNILALNLGVPPTEFTWTRRDKQGKEIETRTYTPQQFYQEYFGNDLKNGYVMIMNDPTRPYYKVYEIDLDRHAYDGDNWRYLNLPMDELKQIAIASIKDSTAMYFSCDVNKFLDSTTGTLDVDNFDYGSLFDTSFNMNKAQRIQTGASASSHAMTLVGVDLDKNGTPGKWLIENSWGSNRANGGYLIATDQWMNEYLFRLVAEKKYVPAKYLEMMKQKPIMLPAWDPLFQGEE